MIKIKLSYKDFDDNPREEEHWFHLSEAEVVEWYMTHEGDDFVDYIKRIIAAEDKKKLIGLFREIVVRSIGRRSIDGRRFEKSEEITAEFTQTNAYSEMFMRLAQDTEFAIKFVNGVIPKDLLERAELVQAKETTVELPQNNEPKKVTDYTFAELVEMEADAFYDLMKKNSHNLPKPFIQAAMQRAEKQEAK